MPDAAIRIGFNTDFEPSILDDYFQKRIAWYEQRLAVSRKVSGRDEFDDSSYIVLASDDRECLGGLRATVRRPGDKWLLPTERVCAGLHVADLFPECDLAGRPHAELAKLVITSISGPPAFTNDLAFRLLHFLLKEHNPEPDVAYALIAGSHRHARLYRGLGRMMGLDSISRAIPRAMIPASYQAVTNGEDATILLFPLRTNEVP